MERLEGTEREEVRVRVLAKRGIGEMRTACIGEISRENSVFLLLFGSPFPGALIGKWVDRKKQGKENGFSKWSDGAFLFWIR